MCLHRKKQIEGVTSQVSSTVLSDLTCGDLSSGARLIGFLTSLPASCFFILTLGEDTSFLSCLLRYKSKHGSRQCHLSQDISQPAYTFLNECSFLIFLNSESHGDSIQVKCALQQECTVLSSTSGQRFNSKCQHSQHEASGVQKGQFLRVNLVQEVLPLGGLFWFSGQRGCWLTGSGLVARPRFSPSMACTTGLPEPAV